MKICTKCKKEYLATREYFFRHVRQKDGLNSWCKKCCGQYTKIYRSQHREYRKNYNKKYELTSRAKIIRRNCMLKSRFGITLEQYDKMFEEQNGNCAICGLPELMKRLAVDHNHETGKVRALLCNRCNLLVGQIENNYELIDGILGYLQERGAKCQ